MIQSIGSGSVSAYATQRLAPPQPPKDAKEAFAKIDTDGSGSLTTDELQAMFDTMAERMGGGGPDAAQEVSRLDTDGDGVVSFEEFEAGRPQGPPPAGQAAESGESASSTDLSKMLDMLKYLLDGGADQQESRTPLDVVA